MIVFRSCLTRVKADGNYSRKEEEMGEWIYVRERKKKREKLVFYKNKKDQRIN